MAMSRSLDSTTGAVATMAEVPQIAVPTPISRPCVGPTLRRRDRYRVRRMMTTINTMAPNRTRPPTRDQVIEIQARTEQDDAQR